MQLLAKNEGNSPQGLILTHLPLFRPFPASIPTLPVLYSPPFTPEQPFTIRPRPFKPSAAQP